MTLTLALIIALNHSSAASKAPASRSGILAVGPSAVGIFDGGRWGSMDSMFAPEGSKHVSKATVARLTAGDCWALGDKGDGKPARHTLEFSTDGPGNFWSVTPEPESPQALVWFGPRPTAPKATYPPKNSAAYLKAAKDYLQTKGFSQATPVVRTALADLDGNGTQEAILCITSRPADEMNDTFEGNAPNPHPKDYAALIIRYLRGNQVKVLEIDYSDGRKQGLAGMSQLTGLWNLDGQPGTNIIVSSTSYESSEDTIYRFKNGKLTRLATAGSGA